PQVQFETMNGIKYLVTPDEVLRVGDKLSTDTLHEKEGVTYGGAFKTFAGLSPYLQASTGGAPPTNLRMGTATGPEIEQTFEEAQGGQGGNSLLSPEMENRIISISEIVLALVAFLVVLTYAILHKRSMPYAESTPLPDAFAKKISTKDESVA